MIVTFLVYQELATQVAIDKIFNQFLLNAGVS